MTVFKSEGTTEEHGSSKLPDLQRLMKLSFMSRLVWADLLSEV